MDNLIKQFKRAFPKGVFDVRQPDDDHLALHFGKITKEEANSVKVNATEIVSSEKDFSGEVMFHQTIIDEKHLYFSVQVFNWPWYLEEFEEPNVEFKTV
jgi:hypothetical protein